MRFTVSPEQHKLFQTKGYLEVEELLEEQEVSKLTKEIAHVQSKIPGYPHENFFRSIETIVPLIKKRGWGQVGAELIHKKPLRLHFDKFFSELPLEMDTLEDDSCGLLVDLTNRKGFFFKDFALIRNLYNPPGNCYFLVVFTSKFLPNQLNPIIAK